MLTEAKRQYHQLYESQNETRLYAAPWWLDVVCSKQGWDAVVSSDTNRMIRAAMPFYKTQIRRLPAVITPPMSQWVDICHTTDDSGVAVQSLFEKLPRSAILDISLRPGIDWVVQEQSYSVMTQYSYILQNPGSPEAIKAGYNEGLRRNLRTSASLYTLEEKDDIGALLKLYTLVYRQKNQTPPWWIDEVIPKLVRTLFEKNCGKLMFAVQGEENIAASLTAWDDSHDYYLVGGRIASDDGISAHALLLNTAIEDAHRRGHDFDFEGSMVPGIAHFFQTFGASPTPYTRVRKYTGLGRLWSLFH